MNCCFCGSCFGKSYLQVQRTNETGKVEAIQYFCDESCYNAYVRDDSRSFLEKSIQRLNKIYTDKKRNKAELKIIKIDLLFITSLLQRKPRHELIRLNDIRKQVLTELIEIEHEKQEQASNEMMFLFGEAFKNDWSDEIDAWCSKSSTAL